MELSATQSALLDAQQQQRQLEAQLTQLQQQLATRNALCAQLQRCILESEVLQPAAPLTEGAVECEDTAAAIGSSRGSSSSSSSILDRARSSASAGLEWLQCVHFVGPTLAADLKLAQQPQQQAACPARLPWSKAVGGPGPPRNVAAAEV
jgi:Tfp pilus assembly protein FimV